MITRLTKLTNLFDQTELQTIEDMILEARASDIYTYEELGRLHVEGVRFPESMQQKLEFIVNDQLTEPLEMLNPPLYVEYNPKYGQPNLQPHVDGDFTDFIIDYQFQSNTEWPLGLNLDMHTLEDNEALLFNPNTNVHWRPRKTFEDGEYVRMIFFRFLNQNSPSDYSHLPHNPADPMFDRVRNFRDSLPES
jgi:hypothetical protein